MRVTKKSGYVFIDGRREHRLVWKAEHGQIPYGWVVHHINSVKDDNHIDNLVALPAWYHDQIHALMKQGVKYTKDDLMVDYHSLYKQHKEYTEQLKDAMKAVKDAKARLNTIGVPSYAIDKYIVKLNKLKDKPKRKKRAITTKQYVEMRKPVTAMPTWEVTEILRAKGL